MWTGNFKQNLENLDFFSWFHSEITNFLFIFSSREKFQFRPGQTPIFCNDRSRTFTSHLRSANDVACPSGTLSFILHTCAPSLRHKNDARVKYVYDRPGNCWTASSVGVCVLCTCTFTGKVYFQFVQFKNKSWRSDTFKTDTSKIDSLKTDTLVTAPQKMANNCAKSSIFSPNEEYILKADVLTAMEHGRDTQPKSRNMPNYSLLKFWWFFH